MSILYGFVILVLSLVHIDVSPSQQNSTASSPSFPKRILCTEMVADGDVAPKAKFSWLTLFKKYFCEGQITSSTLQLKNGEVVIPKADVPTSFVDRHRKFIAMFLPIALVHIIWWSYMISTDSFDAFTETDNTGKNGIPRW